MVAFIFPGQGSQFVGMGKDLYLSCSPSKIIFDTADKLLGFPLSRLCFEGPLEELTLTRNCQIAVFTASVAALEAFKASPGYPRDIRYTAGLSLGEYSALVASGAVGFEAALKLVKKRAELMDSASGRNPGKMSAILGLERSILEEICRLSGAQIANLNCPAQVVITGKIEAVDKAKELSLEKGAKRAVDLEVSGAFHSSLMSEAAAQFQSALDWYEFKDPLIPVVSNVTGLPQYKSQDIKKNLIRQIYSPVLWEDSVRHIAAQGVKTFYEIGPGSILKGLSRKIDPDLKVINIGKKEDISNP